MSESSFTHFRENLESVIGYENINKLTFYDEGSSREYDFQMEDLEVKEEVKETARHTVIRYLHLPSKNLLVAKSFRISLIYSDRNVSQTEEEQMRFINEIKILMKISSDPYIVTFFGICLYENEALLCMESMDLSLHELYVKAHEDNDVFTEEIIGFIVVSVVNALCCCREYGIMHRDIKPSNILLNRYGEIKLSDFGESIMLKGETPTANVGTIAYWPPEKFSMEESNGTEDVWSFGISLLEVIVGKLPYMLENEIIYQGYNYIRKHVIDFIEEDDKNAIINRCLTNFHSVMAEVLIKSCLKDLKKRPNFEELKEFSLYQTYIRVPRKEMEKKMAGFIGKHKDIVYDSNQIFKPSHKISVDLSIDAGQETVNPTGSASPEVQVTTKEISEGDQIIKDLCQKIELLEKKVESLSEQENVKNKSPDVSSRYVVHPELYHGENNVPNNLVDSHDFYMSKNPSVNKKAHQKPVYSRSSLSYNKKLYEDPNINRIEFPDQTTYDFTIGDFNEESILGVSENSMVKKYTFLPNGYLLAVKFVNIPHAPHNTEEENNKLGEKILREIESAKKLRNVENVIHYYGFCLHDSQMLFCMELMDVPLEAVYKKFHKRSRSFPEDLLGCITVALVNGISDCHAKSIMHRNVKPSTIFLKYPDKIKLGDFSESNILRNSLSTSFGGKIWYWPPETFDKETCNKDVEKRDVWALGITLLETIVGRLPYLEENQYDVNRTNNIIFIQSLILNFKPETVILTALKEYSKECRHFMRCCTQGLQNRAVACNLKETWFYQNSKNQKVADVLRNYEFLFDNIVPT